MPTKTSAFRNHLFSFGRAELAKHKNLMTCVVFGREEPVLVANDEMEVDANIVCIKPDVPHSVVVRRGGAEIIYLDGVQIPISCGVFKSLGQCWREIPSEFKDGKIENVDRFRRELQGDRAPPDPLVLDLVEQLYTLSNGRMSQYELSAKLGLERTQALRHFKLNTGQTFRKYKIWAAIIAAATTAHGGEKIGLAGADAGFSDAAHTARTARDIFGLTPTMGLASLESVTTLSSSP